MAAAEEESPNPLAAAAAPSASVPPVTSQPKPGLSSGIVDHSKNSCTTLRTLCDCCPGACECFEVACPCCFINPVHHLFPDAPAVYIDGDIEHTHEKAKVIASFMRLVVAKRRVRMLRRLLNRPFHVKLLRASGLVERKKDLTTQIIGASDPFVVVTALQNQCDHAHSSTDQALFYKSRTIKSSTNPEWNEDIIVSGCNGYAKLVFTVLQKPDTALFTDIKVLGQATHSIARHELWVDNAKAFTVKLPLGPMVEEVFTEAGKPIAPASQTTAGGGELFVEFQPTRTTGMMSSWAESYNYNRKSLTERVTMGPMLLNLADETGWLPRWVVLSSFGIREYFSPQNLNNVSNEIPAPFIGTVTVEPEYRGKEAVVRIQNTMENGQGLILHFPTGADWHEWELKIDVVKKQGAAKAAVEANAKASSPVKRGLANLRGR